MIGIYKIISPAGHVYIGQSWDIHKRFKKYRYTNLRQPIIHRSIVKYGIGLHIFESIHIMPVNSTQKHLDYAECFFLRLYEINGSVMMNVREGGSRGKHSMESKIKCGLANKGRSKPPRTEEHKIKNAQAWVGRSHKPETLLKISQTKKAQHLHTKHTEEAKLKMKGVFGKWMLGRKLSIKTIEKVRSKMQKPISQFTLSGEWIRDCGIRLKRLIWR